MGGRLAVLLSLVAVLSIAAPAEAQVRALGYAIGGVAGVSGFWGSSVAAQGAGGAEALFGGGAGAGAELGALGNSSSVLIVFSANGVYHFWTGRTQRTSPFVTGGYTRMGDADGSFNAWNIGAGVDIWAKERFGFRVDVRDQIRPDSRGTVQYWTIRGGICFR